MKLYLDLSKSRVSKVRLVDGEKVYLEKEGGDTLSLIDQILKEGGVKLEDLEEVDSFPGPGSFTGLKVSAAIANTLNYVLGKEKRVIPSYEAKDAKPSN